MWEYGNSWGYQTISFELTAVDGKKFLVSRREEDFTRNFPSTFQIEPGEHQVYAIRFDERWDTQPSLPKTDEESISLKAIYEVPPTPEAARYRVWTGRLESHTYHLKLRQWRIPGQPVWIAVDQSSYHHLSQNEIASDNPCSQQLFGIHDSAFNRANLASARRRRLAEAIGS